jgi:hypothetical protein
VTEVSFGPAQVVVTVRLRSRRLACTLCRFTTKARYDLRTVASWWRHLDLGRWRLQMRADLARLACPTHGVLTHLPDLSRGWRPPMTSWPTAVSVNAPRTHGSCRPTCSASTRSATTTVHGPSGATPSGCPSRSVPGDGGSSDRRAAGVPGRDRPGLRPCRLVIGLRCFSTSATVYQSCPSVTKGTWSCSSGSRSVNRRCSWWSRWRELRTLPGRRRPRCACSSMHLRRRPRLRVRGHPA